MNLCPICNQVYVPVDVHGHIQCSVCKNNIQPCCQGETCNIDKQEDLGPEYDSAGFHINDRDVKE
jgi:hypothetical protein